MYPIVRSAKSHREFRRSVRLSALRELLPDQQIEDICRQLGHTWRDRKLPPGRTLRSMVYRGLNRDQSIAATLANLAAAWGPDAEAPTDSAWCQARSRLPEAVVFELVLRQAHACRRRFGRACRYHGRWVFIVDCSTLSIPD